MICLNLNKAVGNILRICVDQFVERIREIIFTRKLEG